MEKTVTVAIPVYNGEKYISEALNSIVNQTLLPDQILICDNNSDDNTIKIIEGFKRENPELEIIINSNKTNIGAIPNFNKCMALCQTNFLLILSSDDRLKSDTLENHLKFLTKNSDFALIGGKIDFIDQYGKLFRKAEKQGDQIFKEGQILEFVKATNSFIPISTVMMNMKHIKKFGEWDLYNGAEERYWPKILKVHPIAVSGDSVCEWRIHPEQWGWLDNIYAFNGKKRYFLENLKIAEYETNSDRNIELKKYLKEWLSQQCSELGKVAWIDYNKPKIALKYWKFGLIKNPSALFKKYFLKNIIKSLLRSQTFFRHHN